jgi:VWFA-related protein
MKNPNLFAMRVLTAALLCVFVFGSVIFGQQQQTTAAQTDDVLRINTELVQTGVTILDKQGRFVEGLKPEQFELRVDDKPVELLFFDRVAAWTAREEKQLAAAASGAKASTPSATTPPATSYRGRTIVFFIDDLHLSLDSLGRTRAALTHFIDSEMTPLDQVAFASASGQLGFLQQYTDNKAVLRAALSRLKAIPNTVRDTDQPPMTEFIALRIINGDREAAGIYVDKIVEGFATKGMAKEGARNINLNAIYEMVKTRANQIAFGVESVTKTSLLSLESLLQTSQQIAGRKLVFFISDGFYLNTKNGDSMANAQLQRVTDIATRTGSVIYTIDARGLFAPMADATGDRPFDPKGRLDRSSVGEGILSQDGLNALADDTGGRFLKNQNYFDSWVTRMLDETSNYYLLAWRPPTDEQKGGKFKRISVSIVGRPDLTVRLPRGFLTGNAQPATKSVEAKTPATNSKTSTPPEKAMEAELRAALGAPTARKGLLTQLSTSFVDVPGNGPVLAASMQMATDVLDYGADGKHAAAIDIAGVVLNEQGKPAGSFKTRLNVNPLPSNTKAGETAGVIYNHKLPLKPGLYQVRVASRDERSGRVGSAAQWIEIPDLASQRLTLSSLLVGGQFVGSGQKQATAGSNSEQVQFSVDRRFASGSHLNFLTIIYNAARGASGTAAPNLEAQIRISRDGQTIVTSPLRKITLEAGADPARIPYGADIALKNLPAGRYLLQVTVNDRTAQANATQQITFDIE